MNEFENIINSISEQAKNSNAIEQGDYIGDNGLLYCGKCNTKKQCKVKILGVERIVFCTCKCREEALERERIEQLKRERMLHIQRLRRLGFPDAEMQKWTFDKDDLLNEKITTAAKKYVENFDELKKRGKGLLLYGTVGTGKTFISACIANALIDEGKACLVTNFARLVNTLQGMFEGKQDYIDSLNKFDLLVIDDLASERDTEYMSEIVQSIIDSRYRAGLPLIVTTNLTSKELKHPKDQRKQRIYSRLFEMCFPLEVKLINDKGEPIDRRKMKLKAEFQELNNLLGM